MGIIKFLTALTIVAFMFDGCLNRDPAFYVADDSRIIAISGSSPLVFQYMHFNGTRSQEERSKSFDIDNINIDEFRMSERVYAGQCDNKYFLVNRDNGNHEIYETADEMAAQLEDEFGLKLNDLKPLPWYSQPKANMLYPYNYIYYMLAIFTIVLSHSIRWYKKKKPLPNKPNAADA